MFWIIYFLVRSSFFWDVLGRFSQCNFKIFCCRPTMVTDIFARTKCLLEIYKESEVFDCVAGEYFFNVEWVEVRIKMSEAFEWNCIAKWTIFFVNFCWLGHFLQAKLPNTMFWIINFLVQSLFFRDCFRVF